MNSAHTRPVLPPWASETWITGPGAKQPRRAASPAGPWPFLSSCFWFPWSLLIVYTPQNPCVRGEACWELSSCAGVGGSATHSPGSAKSCSAPATRGCKGEADKESRPLDCPHFPIIWKDRGGRPLLCFCDRCLTGMLIPRILCIGSFYPASSGGVHGGRFWVRDQLANVL